jgi:RHS repeat-associated protein
VDDGIRQRFTQKERDNESGLDYFLARYYSSAQGRFTSVDPSMTSARAIHPQSWNRYSYTINNPLRYTDPTGLDWWYDPDAPTAQPTWFDSDPGGKWKRWTDTYSYVYQPGNAGGLWVALNPSGPQAFLTDTEERAQAKSDEWAGSGLFNGTPSERDWVAGFGVGSSPLGVVLGCVNGLAGADTTSREYQGGVNTGILASTIAGGGAGVIRSLTASSRSVQLAEKALAKGATEVHVKSAEEAAEVYLRNYHGSGYANTTGMTGNQVRNDTFLFPGRKKGTYHWDLADTQHGGAPHLQVHTHDGRTVRIFFPIGGGG